MVIATLKRLEILIGMYEQFISTSSDEKSITAAKTFLEDCRQRYHQLHNEVQRKKSTQNELDYETFSS